MIMTIQKKIKCSEKNAFSKRIRDYKWRKLKKDGESAMIDIDMPTSKVMDKICYVNWLICKGENVS
ncbi:hypothetical protein CSV67_12260 [Sporosarcina sp. P2]|nr:hypothetical protein CSV67_12260 [Sporosarcina sp. P2]